MGGSSGVANVEHRASDVLAVLINEGDEELEGLAGNIADLEADGFSRSGRFHQAIASLHTDSSATVGEKRANLRSE